MDEALIERACSAVKAGAFGIARLGTGEYFTFDWDGDDLVLTDELREAVERRLGCRLVEKVFPGFEGQTNLVAPD